MSAGWMRRGHKGQAYYLVEFPYDPNYEYFHAGFAARIYFGADTGIGLWNMNDNYLRNRKNNMNEDMMSLFKSIN